MAFGNLDSQRFAKNRHGELEMARESVYDPITPPLRGPDNTLMLQALTTRSAGDSIDLERLETLGDSFLKFSTTVFLYHDRSTDHEGVLSKSRARRVCNKNLYTLANRKNITTAILSSTFNPRQMWIPPCSKFDRKFPHFTYPDLPKGKRGAGAAEKGEEGGGGGGQNAPKPLSVEEKHYLYHKLTDKGVADSMESLIGAYLVSGGISAGLKFMAWMGVKILPKTASVDCDCPPLSSLPTAMEEEMRSASLSSSLGSSSSSSSLSVIASVPG